MTINAENIAVLGVVSSFVGQLVWAAILFGMLRERVKNVSTGLKGVQKDVKEILLILAKGTK